MPRASRSGDAPSGTRSGDGRHRPTTTRVIVVGIGPPRPHRAPGDVREPAHPPGPAHDARRRTGSESGGPARPTPFGMRPVRSSGSKTHLCALARNGWPGRRLAVTFRSYPPVTVEKVGYTTLTRGVTVPALPTFPIDDFPVMWLRDNCPCADCRDPRSGQKLFQISALPAALRLDAVTDTDESEGPAVEVIWAPDGHRSTYPVTWLEANRPGGAGDRRPAHRRPKGTVEGRRPHRTAAASGLGRVSGRAGCAGPHAGFRIAAGFHAAERGTGARGTGARRGGDLRLRPRDQLREALRRTRRARPEQPRLHVGPHHAAHRQPVPRSRCRRSSCCTAWSTTPTAATPGLVDGFAAAALLREEDPEAFDVLTRTPVPFVFRDARHRTASRPSADRRRPPRPGPRGALQQPFDRHAPAARRRGGGVLRGLPHVRGTAAPPRAATGLAAVARATA